MLEEGRKVRIAKKIFFLSIFLLFSAYAHSLEIKSDRVTDEISWVLETTMGWQNITDVMSREDGGTSQIKQGLNFKGILFHSFWYDKQTIKSQMNLGFHQKEHFLWTDEPDFTSGETRYSESLRCIDYEIQFLFPLRATPSLTISPYTEYSFIEHSFDTNFSGMKSSTVMFNSFFMGIEFFHKISKSFTQDFFFSYSPIVWENYSKSKMQFIAYGFETITNTHPVAITLFMTIKKAFMQKGRLIFDGTYFKFTTTITGFSMHINLR